MRIISEFGVQRISPEMTAQRSMGAESKKRRQPGVSCLIIPEARLPVSSAASFSARPCRKQASSLPKRKLEDSHEYRPFGVSTPEHLR